MWEICTRLSPFCHDLKDTLVCPGYYDLEEPILKHVLSDGHSTWFLSYSEKHSHTHFQEDVNSASTHFRNLDSIDWMRYPSLISLRQDTPPTHLHQFNIKGFDVLYFSESIVHSFSAEIFHKCFSSSHNTGTLCSESIFTVLFHSHFSVFHWVYAIAISNHF